VSEVKNTGGDGERRGQDRRTAAGLAGMVGGGQAMPGTKLGGDRSAQKKNLDRLRRLTSKVQKASKYEGNPGEKMEKKGVCQEQPPRRRLYSGREQRMAQFRKLQKEN